MDREKENGRTERNGVVVMPTWGEVFEYGLKTGAKFLLVSLVAGLGWGWLAIDYYRTKQTQNAIVNWISQQPQVKAPTAVKPEDGK